jgi:hypothetical protein
VLHSLKKRTGFRRVRLVQDALDEGTTFYFEINNVPIWMGGERIFLPYFSNFNLNWRVCIQVRTGYQLTACSLPSRHCVTVAGSHY